jgi:hypothetical protein
LATSSRKYSNSRSSDPNAALLRCASFRALSKTCAPFRLQHSSC